MNKPLANCQLRNCIKLFSVRFRDFKNRIITSTLIFHQQFPTSPVYAPLETMRFANCSELFMPLKNNSKKQKTNIFFL